MTLPSLHGNWVDLGIILFVVFYIWEGSGKGFLTLFFELISFVGSFLLALKLYPVLANLLISNFSFSKGVANAASFFVLGLIGEQVLVSLGGLIVARIPEKWKRHELNRILSFLPLLANAIIIEAFVLTLVLALPVQATIKSAVSASKLGGPMIEQTQLIEKKLSSIFGDALSDSFNFFTTGPIGTHEEVKLNFTQHDLTIDLFSETEMLARVNKERRDRGINELVVNTNLRDLARTYARDMFEQGFFSHYNPEGESPFDRMNKAGIPFNTAGENLALAPSVAIAHQGLMNSQGHRENILNPEFHNVGIGVIDGGVYGKMFVQEFTN